MAVKFWQAAEEKGATSLPFLMNMEARNKNSIFIYCLIASIKEAIFILHLFFHFSIFSHQPDVHFKQKRKTKKQEVDPKAF
jgi:hypothetical protein